MTRPDDGDDRVDVAHLAARIRAAEPRLGGVRLVCVDGPAGSGKTTLAGRLATALGPGATVVAIEDLYAGWTLTGAFARLAASVLRPLATGQEGGYRRYDWRAGDFERTTIPVPPPEVLLVEGCGSCPRAVDGWTSLRIWVEVPRDVGLARGLARDGLEYADDWRRWQRLEAVAFEAEDTRARADVRLAGSAIPGAGRPSTPG